MTSDAFRSHEATHLRTMNAVAAGAAGALRGPVPEEEILPAQGPRAETEMITSRPWWIKRCENDTLSHILDAQCVVRRTREPRRFP